MARGSASAVGARAARGARPRLGLGAEEAPADLLELVEARAGVGVLVVDYGDRLAGAYLRRPAGSLIVVNGAEAVVRQRFTLAHELAHHVLGHPTVLDEEIDDTRDPREVEANAFAAELLAPFGAVRRWAAAHVSGEINLMAVVDLAARFGISARAARIRLSTVRLLPDEARRRRLDSEIDDNLHLLLAGYHDRRDRDDSLARAKQSLPRLPFGRDHGGLAALLRDAGFG